MGEGQDVIWENGYVESFNGRLRDELLAREQFDTLLEAKVLIERWRRHYNTVRPHGSLGYRPPAPEAIQPLHFVPATPPRSEVARLAVMQRVTLLLVLFVGAGHTLGG